MSNKINYPAIRAALDVAHPTSGAWNADDALAADQMNVADIEGPGKTSISQDEFFRVIYNQKAAWDAITADNQGWIERLILANPQGIPADQGNPTRVILQGLLPGPI